MPAELDDPFAGHPFDWPPAAVSPLLRRERSRSPHGGEPSPASSRWRSPAARVAPRSVVARDVPEAHITEFFMRVLSDREWQQYLAQPVAFAAQFFARPGQQGVLATPPSRRSSVFFSPATADDADSPAPASPVLPTPAPPAAPSSPGAPPWITLQHHDVIPILHVSPAAELPHGEAGEEETQSRRQRQG